VPLSTFWLLTTALEVILVAWWLRSPVARVWLHFIGGLLKRRGSYWAPPWKHRWVDDVSRPPLPLSPENRRSLVAWLIGSTAVGIATGYALVHFGDFSNRGASFCFC
jgi:hypothetical protein